MDINIQKSEFRAFRPINGSLMNKYMNMNARIFIFINETLAGGTKIKGRTTDNKDIIVELDDPLNQPLQSWIEVLGVPKNGNTFRGEQIYCFEQDENNEPFDEESHNSIISILDKVDDKEFYRFK